MLGSATDSLDIFDEVLNVISLSPGAEKFDTDEMAPEVVEVGLHVLSKVAGLVAAAAEYPQDNPSSGLQEVRQYLKKNICSL